MFLYGNDKDQIGRIVEIYKYMSSRGDLELGSSQKCASARSLLVVCFLYMVAKRGRFHARC